MVDAGAIPAGSGIYRIVCVANGGKTYIGSAISLRRRWAEHRNSLRAGRHGNPHLQNAWRKYGEAAFRFEVVEVVPADRLLDAEQKHIDLCHDKFNICPKAGSSLGVKRSKATRAALSLARKGCAVSAETREKLRAVNLGKRLSEETRGKMKAAVTGRKATPQAIANMRKAQRSRAEKMKAWAAEGDPRGARYISQQTREKISAATKGRRVSEETRSKMRASALACWAARRSVRAA